LFSNGNGTHFCLPRRAFFNGKTNNKRFSLPFLLRVRGVFGCSSVASARLGQSFGYKELKYVLKIITKVYLTGKPAESGGVSIVLLFEEVCCQAAPLLEFDMAVSFGIVPRVLFRTRWD
jgi:hypothetical protein